MRYPTGFLLTRPSRGATRISVCWWKTEQTFLLTRPSRGATMRDKAASTSDKISTHTPLAGRDIQLLYHLLRPVHFYSHAPRGARQGSATSMRSHWRFLLTRPSRGATCWTIWARSAGRFLLTRPSRGATIKTNGTTDIYVISTHTPLAGRDDGAKGMLLLPDISTHTPLAGRDKKRPCAG